MNERNFITIQGWMHTELNLCGNKLIAFAIVWGYTQNGNGIYTAGSQYVADWCGCTERSARTYLKELVADGLITEVFGYDEKGKRYCHYLTPEKFSTPENISNTPENISEDTGKNFRYNINRDNININNNIPPLSKESSPHFKKPSLEEVRAYCFERNNTVSPEAFIAFYESNGWKVGKNPMKDWRAAVRTWEQRDRQNPSPRSGRPSLQKEDNYVTNGLRILKEIREGTFMQNIYGNE